MEQNKSHLSVRVVPDLAPMVNLMKTASYFFAELSNLITEHALGLEELDG